MTRGGRGLRNKRPRVHGSIDGREIKRSLTERAELLNYGNASQSTSTSARPSPSHTPRTSPTIDHCWDDTSNHDYKETDESKPASKPQQDSEFMNWRGIMPLALHAIKRFFYETSAPDTTQETETNYRCITCGDSNNQTLDEISEQHTSNRRKTHVIQELVQERVLDVQYEVWRTLRSPPWGDSVDFSCKIHASSDTQKPYNLTLVRLNGHQDRRLITCKCTDLLTSLLSCGFFPASPSQPKFAIDMELLEEFHLLNVTCHVSNYSYAAYLNRKSTNEDSIDLYRLIQGCYRPWSLLYQQSQRMAKDFSEPARIDCPVCTRSGNPTITLDACFGATSLLKNSLLDAQPQQSHDYLLKDLTKEVIAGADEEDIDLINTSPCEHMASNPTNERTESSYFQGLHYTGLMGSICKHGMPLWFLNISHGKEKAVFGAKIIQHVQSLPGKNKWNIKYDIMCK